MPSYRFCRPDDRELLIHAINTCVQVHTGNEPFTEQDYNRQLRELNFWPSSCVLALGNTPKEVLAGCFGCKRQNETFLLMLGTRPDQFRKGHMLHLLDSLSKKLGILGPPAISAEVAAEDLALKNLFAKAGYEIVSDYLSYRGDPLPSDPKVSSLVDQISVGDLASLGLLEFSGRAWIRQRESLENLSSELRGLAIVSSKAVDAYVLYRRQVDRVELLSIRAETLELLYALVAKLSEYNMQLFVPKLTNDELPGMFLETLGFAVMQKYLKFHRIAEIP